MNDPHTSDRIERQIVLSSPRARVWRALTDAGQFGTWFRVKLSRGFAVGERAMGHITWPGYEHLKFECTVERMEPARCFAFRWHPYAIDPEADYSREPPTLVEFILDDTIGGTRLTVLESGFARVPEERRAEAYAKNSEGWDVQLRNIKEFLGD